VGQKAAGVFGNQRIILANADPGRLITNHPAADDGVMAENRQSSQDISIDQQIFRCRLSAAMTELSVTSNQS
jgi:hypothetical protein